MNLIRPSDVPPTDNPGASPETIGKSVHRRVVSRARGGPGTIDVGFNKFKAGLENTTPYAYTKDEFCYTPHGEMHSTSDGVVVIQRPGTFMWRPAGASSERQSVRQDTTTICAFGPAREDDWSHRLPAEQVGVWAGDEGKKPVPRYFHYTAIKPRPWPLAPQDAHAVHRPVISQARDGSMHMEVSHTTIEKATITVKASSAREEVWWLESGALTVCGDGTELRLEPGDFLQLSPGDRLDWISVAEPAVLICYSAPPGND